MTPTLCDDAILELATLVGRALHSREGNIPEIPDGPSKPDAAAAYAFEERYANVADFIVNVYRKLDEEDASLGAHSDRPAKFQNACVFFGLLGMTLLHNWNEKRKTNKKITPPPKEFVEAVDVLSASHLTDRDWLGSSTITFLMKKGYDSDQTKLESFPRK